MSWNVFHQDQCGKDSLKIWEISRSSSKGVELTLRVDTGRYTDSDAVSIINMQVGVDVHLARICSIIVTGLSASVFLLLTIRMWLG